MTLGIKATDTTNPFTDAHHEYLKKQAQLQQTQIDRSYYDALNSNQLTVRSNAPNPWQAPTKMVYHLQIEEIDNGYLLTFGGKTRHYCADKTALGEMVATQLLVMEQQK